jgi:hypothetical protein
VRWLASAHVHQVEQAGESVLLNMETGKFYGLDLVGCTIWRMLAEPMDLDQIVCTLHSTYGTDLDTLHRDVSQFIAALDRNKLVKRA